MAAVVIGREVEEADDGMIGLRGLKWPKTWESRSCAVGKDREKPKRVIKRIRGMAKRRALRRGI